jgi:TatD DNase family protein
MTFYTIDFGVNYANTKKYPKEHLENIINTSYNKSVDKVVCISNNYNECKNNIELAKQYSNLYFTLGIHPHNAKYFNTTDLIFIEKHLSHPKCFGIGECGLDYNRNFSSIDDQKNAFEHQVQLAKKYNTKLYLHCRDAYDDFMFILDKYNYYNGLVHCFTGTEKQAKELTSRGFKLGITGVLLDKKRNSILLNIIKNISLEMLVVETDAPYMSYFGKKESYPEDTSFIIYEIAKIKNIDPILCGNIIYKNSLNFLQKSV